uniref:Uncharacterized protein n=1 Tax=Heligmosomoides polygyrus TaxID=6339 RepID=A0A183GRW6_HELPZ
MSRNRRIHTKTLFLVTVRVAVEAKAPLVFIEQSVRSTPNSNKVVLKKILLPLFINETGQRSMLKPHLRFPISGVMRQRPQDFELARPEPNRLFFLGVLELQDICKIPLKHGLFERLHLKSLGWNRGELPAVNLLHFGRASFSNLHFR